MDHENNPFGELKLTSREEMKEELGDLELVVYEERGNNQTTEILYSGKVEECLQFIEDYQKENSAKIVYIQPWEDFQKEHPEKIN